MKFPSRTSALFFAMGFAAMVAQIVVMRRLIVAFGGNELVTGAAFAGWLFWSGVGNIIAGTFADRLKNVPRAAAIAIFFMVAAIPLTVIASHLLKSALGIPPPVIVSFSMIVVATIALLAPLGIAIGLSFTIACRLPGKNDATDIGKVYALDVLGSGLGGIVFSFFAVRYFSPIETSLVAAAVLIAAIGFSFRRRTIEFAALVAVVLLAVCILKTQTISAKLSSIEWLGFNPIAQKETLFANLMVTDNRGERTMFVNGRPSFSLPLPETYETIAHLPLIQHQNPKDILIIGGGISGMVDQLQKWNPASAHFARLDEEMTRLELDAMPSELNRLPAWAHIHHTDARRLIKEGLPPPAPPYKGGEFDVIIVNVGDPDTAAADRYFTAEFFEDASRALKPGGVIAIAMLDPANAMGAETARVLGMIRRALATAFDNVIVLPFDRYYFIASKTPGVLTDDPDEIIKRVDDKKIAADFFKAREVAGTSLERIRAAEAAINSAAAGSTLNTDRRPAAYHADMLLWEARSGTGEKGFLSAIGKARWWMGWILLSVLFVASMIFGRRNSPGIKASWVLSAIGYASIVYEIVLIVHYQMTMGILVWRIGIILTAFMAGAGLGTFAAMAMLKKVKISDRLIILSLIAFAFYMPLLFFVSGINFFLANLAAGLFSGWIYQIAAKRLVDEKPLIGKASAIIQYSDCWGAATGALIASLILVPLFGLMPALISASVSLFAAAGFVEVMNTRKV